MSTTDLKSIVVIVNLAVPLTWETIIQLPPNALHFIQVSLLQSQLDIILTSWIQLTPQPYILQVPPISSSKLSLLLVIFFPHAHLLLPHPYSYYDSSSQNVLSLHYMLLSPTHITFILWKWRHSSTKQYDITPTNRLFQHLCRSGFYYQICSGCYFISLVGTLLISCISPLNNRHNNSQCITQS